MKLLLDTHGSLWLRSDPGQLSSRARLLLADPANELWVSTASIWEIQTKVQAGKLTIPARPTRIVFDQQSNGIKVLPIDLADVHALDQLPTSHKDPFDRMLVARAIAEGASLPTRDPVFAHYPVPVEW